MITLHRQFAKKAVAAILLVALFAIPVCAGAVILLSPLQQEVRVRWHRVTPLSSVEDDGVPFSFRVDIPQTDGWTRLPDRPGGAVFLTRLPGTHTVTALAATHQSGLSIPVSYDAKQGIFKSMCWKVRFSTAGKCLDSDPRMEDMRALQTKVVDGIVWVESQP